MASRQERRRRLRKLKKVIEAVSQRGVNPQIEFIFIEIAAVVAMMSDVLRKESAPGRSTRLVRLISRLQDLSNRHDPCWQQVECRKGCHYCCHIYVSASAFHVFAIADYIRRKAHDLSAEIERLEAADMKTRGRDLQARLGEWVACPLLADGLCSVYPVRPPACRGFHSLSVRACEAVFRREQDEIPKPPYTEAIRSAYENAVLSALVNEGRPTVFYELAHAVIVALKDPQSEVRWYAGEAVFDGVKTDEIYSPFQYSQEDCKLLWDSLWCVAHGDTPPPGPYFDKFPAWCHN